MKMLEKLHRELQLLDARGLRRTRRTADSACAPHQTVDGKPMLAFCSNDYLGLAAHPRIISALQEGAACYGAGSGASHLINGHSRAHALLEDRLADFVAPHLDMPRALYFSTGYMANLAVLTALTDSESAIFSESLNHASLIDGMRLSRAAVQIYPHHDLDALRSLLCASNAKTKLVVTDSVFSMDGEVAPLPQLLALCEEYGAWLVVDDAHGFGVLGSRGRGVLEHFGMRSPHVIYMGTLGKAAGVSGAFVAAHHTVIEWLLQRARSYIYTTASPPALAHALLASLDIIGGPEGSARREHLHALTGQFKNALHSRTWRRIESDTPIQPVIIGTNAEAMQVADALYAQGLWVPAIRPPTVPAETARLRVTLSAAHTHDDVMRLAAALNQLEPIPEMEI